MESGQRVLESLVRRLPPLTVPGSRWRWQTGLSTSAYTLAPLHLSAFTHPTWGQIGWTIVIGLAAAIVTIPVRRLGLATAGFVPKQPFVVIPVVGLVVAGLAIVFDQITDKGVRSLTRNVPRRRELHPSSLLDQINVI